MSKISYARHHFPPSVIQHAVWLYLRFNLSLRDVEDLLAERGVTVSYETIRDWVNRFGRQFAARIRRDRPAPADKWHLDELVIRVKGKTHWLWRILRLFASPVGGANRSVYVSSGWKDVQSIAICILMYSNINFSSNGLA